MGNVFHHETQICSVFSKLLNNDIFVRSTYCLKISSTPQFRKYNRLVSFEFLPFSCLSKRLSTSLFNSAFLNENRKLMFLSKQKLVEICLLSIKFNIRELAF